MCKIKVKYFGPIKEGYAENDGWLDINKVTVFIGDQASGKSTLAKLVSIFLWLEKSIVKHTLPIEVLNTDIFKRLCIQQEIYEYFSSDTLIAFKGTVYEFEYNEQKSSFVGKYIEDALSKYIMPKIQYVSAARNLLTILYNIKTPNVIDKEGNLIDSSGIPYMVRDLNYEYIRGLQKFAKDGFELPINDTKVYFENHNTFIKTKDKRVSMSSAASGIQSITPLLVVSKFLSDEVNKDIFEKIQTLEPQLLKIIEHELLTESQELHSKFKQIVAFGSGILNKDEAERELIKRLLKYIPSSFVNVVEEPEQNLFPVSQQSVINQLLEYNNSIVDNKLIITTHSPYIIGYLSLAVKAYQVLNKSKNEHNKSEINKIVPITSSFDGSGLNIYELDASDGTIGKLEDYNGIPLATNYLNRELAIKNEQYAQLLDLEDE